MNPWNRLLLIQSWLMVLCAAGGTFLADEPMIAWPVLILNTGLLTAVLAGSDRTPS